MSRNVYFPGVVSDLQFAIGSTDGPRVIIAKTPPIVTALLALAEAYNLDYVWVAPGSLLSACDPIAFCNADHEVWDIRYVEEPGTHTRLARMKRVVAWRRSGTFTEKRTIEIVFPEQTSWEWEEESPLTILLALQRMHHDFGFPVGSHPGAVGRDLMKWFVLKDLQLTPHIDLAQLPAKCGRDFAWKKPIETTAKELNGGLWLHCYDKNSMYVSAASNCALGIGDPVYFGPEHTMKEPDIRNAGLWRVEVDPISRVVKGIPGPLETYRYKLPFPLPQNQEWCTSPVLKCLIEMGWHVQVFEGYEWPLSRRALGKWAEALWGHRMTYKELDTEEGQLCYFSMKRIATASIGLLASDTTPLKEKMWYRPDWWSTIIETAKARMLYNIDHYGKDYGMWPVMVYTDALYYVSDSPMPDKRLLQRENELGGYKYKSGIPVNQDVIDWFNSEMSAGEVARLVNTWAQKRETAWT